MSAYLNIVFVNLFRLLCGINLIVGVISVQKWIMHNNCGGTFLGYGGEIFFDSLLLPHGHASSCHMTVIGNGSDDSMLSFFFTSFNITVGCGANLTLQEVPMGPMARNRSYALGLRESFCVSNPYLNENLMYTTNHRFLRLTYTKNHYQMHPKMSFHIKLTTFLSRTCHILDAQCCQVVNLCRSRGNAKICGWETGCTEPEKQANMYSCRTGRCVHMDVVCQNLNPCGDFSDCHNGTAAEPVQEEKGLHYIQLVVVAAVVVFLLFALIQICLIVRNEHKACRWKEPEVRIQAELVPMYIESNGRVIQDNRNTSEDPI